MVNKVIDQERDEAQLVLEPFIGRSASLCGIVSWFSAELQDVERGLGITTILRIANKRPVCCSWYTFRTKKQRRSCKFPIALSTLRAQAQQRINSNDLGIKGIGHAISAAC